MSKNVFWVVAQLPQTLKSTLFEIFSHSTGPFGAAPFEKFSINVDFSFEANSALSQENETEIVKITHSAPVHQLSISVILENFWDLVNLL